jgi:hypothetical protein
VVASASIPGVFRPKVVQRKPEGHSTPTAAADLGEFVDGGMLKNFPIDRFDKEKYRAQNGSSTSACTNYQTLGFNLVNPRPTGAPGAQSSAGGFPGMGLAVFDIYGQSEDHLRESEEHFRNMEEGHRRHVDIDSLGVNAVFGCFLPDKTKTDLMNSGWECVRRAFLNYDNLAIEYQNHDPTRILSIFQEPELIPRFTHSFYYRAPFDEFKESERSLLESAAIRRRHAAGATTPPGGLQLPDDGAMSVEAAASPTPIANLPETVALEYESDTLDLLRAMKVQQKNHEKRD